MNIGNDPPDKLKLSALERAVLQAQASVLGEGGNVLLSQVQHVAVLARNHSGVGFVTRFRVSEGAPRLPADVAGRIRPVPAAHPGLSEPAEFLVQVKDGYLASIEAYCPEGMWPPDDTQFRVGGSTRDA